MANRRCRVTVFIDGQNVHQDFRRAFIEDPNAISRLGAFDPLALAKLFVSRGPDFEDWTLKDVRVYVGAPVAEREPRSAMAHDRQVAAWRSKGITVRPRPLMYPKEWPEQKARQKGVDVELAIDVVSLAIGHEYEIGILASTDTDLVPAIEAVAKVRGFEATPRICVVAYEGLLKQLRLKGDGNRLHAFRLTRGDFEAVQDLTDYTA